MTDPIKLLLFEDGQDDAKKILDGLTTIAQRDNQFRVVWFAGPFSMPVTGGRDRSRPYPLRGEAQVCDVSKGSYISRKSGPGEEWWQRDFDMAILDLLDKESGQQIGYQFATWWQKSEHRGVVVITSRGAQTSGKFPALSQKWAPKSDSTWPQNIIMHLPKQRIAEPRVNCFGRPWDRLLQEFHHAQGSRNWRCAYFGDTYDLAEKTQKFFSLDQKFHPLGKIEEVFDTKEPKPNLIFVEAPQSEGAATGEPSRVLDEPLVQRTFRAIGNNPMLVLFLTQGETVKSDVLMKLNAGIINRDEFDLCPSFWAQSAVKHLLSCHVRFQKVIKNARPTKPRGKAAKGAQKGPRPQPSIPWTSDVIETGSELFRSLHGPMAMARSVDKLVGQGSLPSWVLDPNKQLSGMFSLHLGDLIKQLKRRNLVDHEQAAFYVHD